MSTRLRESGAGSALGSAANKLFWRLPYQLRQQVFRRLRPELAAYYNRLLHGQDGGYSIQRMLERDCLFIHIPKCAGLAVSHALFDCPGGGHLPVAHYQLVLDAAQYARLFKDARRPTAINGFSTKAYTRADAAKLITVVVPTRARVASTGACAIAAAPKVTEAIAINGGLT